MLYSRLPSKSFIDVTSYAGHVWVFFGERAKFQFATLPSHSPFVIAPLPGIRPTRKIVNIVIPSKQSDQYSVVA